MSQTAAPITIQLTGKQIDGVSIALSLALNDQEIYAGSGNPTLDYSANDLRGKANDMQNCAAAANALGLVELAERFDNVADEFRMMADSMEYDDADEETPEDTDSLEDRGIELGSYES